MVSDQQTRRKKKARASDDHPTDTRPNRRHRPERKRWTGFWILLMLFCFLEALGYVWCRVQCVNTGFSIDQETGRYQELVKTRSLLKLEHALLKSPERIETISRTRLGLVRPNSEQTLILP